MIIYISLNLFEFKDEYEFRKIGLINSLCIQTHKSTASTSILNHETFLFSGTKNLEGSLGGIAHGTFDF